MNVEPILKQAQTAKRQRQAREFDLANRKDMMPQVMNRVRKSIVADYDRAIADLRARSEAEMAEAFDAANKRLETARAMAAKREREMWAEVPASMVLYLQTVTTGVTLTELTTLLDRVAGDAPSMFAVGQVIGARLRTMDVEIAQAGDVGRLERRIEDDRAALHPELSRTQHALDELSADKAQLNGLDAYGRVQGLAVRYGLPDQTPEVGDAFTPQELAAARASVNTAAMSAMTEKATA